MSFEQTKEIVSLYIGSSETFIQLSSAAIGFSIAFVEKLSGPRGLKQKNAALVSSWCLFLLAIGFGALYQYCAIKLLDSKSDNPSRSGLIPEIFLNNPGKVYAAMMFSFYAGAVLLVSHGVSRVRKLYEERT